MNRGKDVILLLITGTLANTDCEEHAFALSAYNLDPGYTRLCLEIGMVYNNSFCTQRNPVLNLHLLHHNIGKLSLTFQARHFHPPLSGQYLLYHSRFCQLLLSFSYFCHSHFSKYVLLSSVYIPGTRQRFFPRLLLSTFSSPARLSPVRVRGLFLTRRQYPQRDL